MDVDALHAEVLDDLFPALGRGPMQTRAAILRSSTTVSVTFLPFSLHYL
jgi:hypothetical protein